MPAESPISPDLREDLVAYLDGELDEAATQRIERSLAQSAALRNEVEVLTRTMDMLDMLPRPAASEEFTAQTLSTIHVARKDDAGETTSWFQKNKRRVITAGWIAGLALSVLLGVLIGSRLGEDESDRLVEDYPVVRDLDIYNEIGSIDYLRKLEERGLFHDNEPSPRP